MSGNDPKATQPVWPQNLALPRVSDRIRLESSQCVAALSAIAPGRNGSLPRDNSVRILIPQASTKSAQRAHRENRKAGTQRSLHSQRTFRSVFLLRFQFPKIGRTGNFRLVLACKSEPKSNFNKKVPVPKLKREMSHQRVKPGEHMEIHSDGSHMHSDHFLGLVEARFRAKYDDRVLLAERLIIVALLKPPRWHATLELRYFC
jgi:hypothetical protein